MEKSLTDLIRQFDKIWIDEKSLNSSVAKRFQKLFPSEKIQIVSEDPFQNHKGDLTAEQFNQSKRRIYIKPFAGSFFKRCPGFSQKKAFSCCNYHVLNLGQQCHYNCSYCYLQSYLNYPATLVFSNIETALREIENMALEFPDQPFRVGTGEVIDSLSLDPLTLYSRDLISLFNKFPKWSLELKTKSNSVDQFLDCEHIGNTMISWSINAPFVIEKEEHGTATLDQRLIAAQKCVDKKFPIAFHIDPMIWHPEWKKNYLELAERITSQFSPDDVKIVSLGTLRFQPEQRHLMRDRFGMTSLVLQSEMHLSENGKLRYDAGLRREMVQIMIDHFKNKDPRWNIMMCMETPETWISTYNSVAPQVEPLKEIFRPLPRIKLPHPQSDILQDSGQNRHQF